MTTIDAMTIHLTERERRLPKWAQDELVELRRSLDHARRDADAARLRTSPDESDTLLEGRVGRPEVGLGNGSTIVFRTAHDDVSVRVMSDGVLDVTSDRRTLLVEGRATNHLYLHTKERA